MSNHIHLIWQIQDGHERDAVQRNFLKFISQTIKRDLEKNHPKVLERFYVGAKDREYLPSWQVSFTGHSLIDIIVDSAVSLLYLKTLSKKEGSTSGNFTGATGSLE